MKQGAVAIVGIGCRFPGGVVDPRSFWKLLLEGRDAITEVPANRIDLQQFFDPRPATPGRMMSRRGGFLDHIEDFDPGFFGISPREAERIDPQQRLLLEVAWEAFEDAGENVNRLEGSRTGVYVGQWTSDFESRLFADAEGVDFQMTTGSGRYAASGRLSYVFGLRGPSMTIDSACSSSLAAVHLAVAAIRAGECPLALAGGVNMILQPHISVAYSQSRMMAPDGHCKFGDASGDGYVRSEGAALVLLKPLAQALADGDRIHAVVRGSAVNNDGRSSGVLGRPSRIGHEEMLRAAYADAGVAPSQVGYVEAHGTGTRAGDPVELAALGAVIGAQRPASSTCLVGSVKTNIGHTESAAGVAGLIKAALALRHGLIPASLHFADPNPGVPWGELPFRVPTATSAWPATEGPRLAGVNSFGISGSNAHVVLEEAPPQSTAEPSPLPRRPALLVLSARSEEALRALAARHAELLTGADAPALYDVCWQAATRRTPLERRAAFVAADAATMAAALLRFAAGEAAETQGTVYPGALRKLVFVLPGQGAQWAGMARELMASEPVFDAALRACDAAARPWLAVSIREQLLAEADSAAWQLDRIDVIQPVLVAIAIALAQWWRSLAIVPDAVVGHSMGEVAAAHLAGVLDLDQAMRIICRRSALMAHTSGQGAMAMVELAMAEAERRLAGRGALFQQQVAVAASNSPSACVLSGEPAALDALLAELDADGVFCRRVKVDVASHSPQMEVPAAALTAELAGLLPQAAALPIVSTLLARAAQGSEFDAGYWGRNMREPVRFEACVSQLLDDGARCFIELGPHPVLCGAIVQTAQARGLDVLAQACGRRDTPEQASAMAAIAALWAAGHDIAWAAVLPRASAAVALPLYPWQRERHWCAAAARMAGPAATADGAARPGHHPLLERRFDAAALATTCWETALVPARFAYLADHVVRGSVLFPAAACCDAALAAAAESRPGQRWSLADVEFQSAFALAPTALPRLQVQLRWSGEGAGSFSIHGLASDDAGERWQQRASGRIVAGDTPAPAAAQLPNTVDSGSTLSPDEIYALLADAGLAYGPAFQGLRTLRIAGPLALASVQLDSATLDPRAARHACFPPLLDAVLQVFAAVIARAEDDQTTPVPVGIGRLELPQALPLDSAITVHLSLQVDASDRGDADLYDAQGRWLGALRGVVFQRMRPPRSAALDEKLFVPAWVATTWPSTARPAIGAVVVVAQAPATAQPLVDAFGAAGLQASLLLVHELADAQAPQRLAARLGAAAGARGQIVLLTALECPPADAGQAWIETAWQRIGDDTLALARSMAATDVPPPRVWLVTRGAVAAAGADDAVAAGPAALWGMGRVWAHEQPALDIGLVDLDLNVDPASALPALLLAQPAERQLALRRGSWLVLRLAPLRAATQPPAVAVSHRVVLGAPGEPDTLAWQTALLPPPQAHEVEIEVDHAGLNFMNLMSALGVYPGYDSGSGPLGIECAGRVLRVGAAVTRVAVGDAVLAIGPACLQRHALVDAELVAPQPRALASEIAAGLPIAFLTAWYALRHLARLEAGESVLIHSAAGGVGLAALQIARQAGAVVYATAGTDAKRALLRTLGVQHVFDSRGAGFADAVRAASGGRGVDVVLNSLAGDAIAAGLQCLAPYGRFVELGKRDIYGGASVALAPFRANLAYFAVDLDRMMRERPAQLGAMLRALVRGFDHGDYQPLPVTAFAADDLVAAFKNLMPGTHVGKHVVALQPAPQRLQAAPGLHSVVRADGCYLVTGGLGALGLEVARWLARRGAGALMLVGRNAPSAAAAQTLAEIEAGGTRVLTAACDVADASALAAVLARARGEGGPLRGVFHAAGTLADATLGEMSAAALRAPRDAKVLGAWHLDRLTAGDTLDSFVMFSSVASLFGTPGQGNYAAANAFLDALAHDRRGRGLAGLAVNFGPVADVGLAAAGAVRGSSLRRLGFDGMAAADAVEAIDRLLAVGATQAVCATFDATRWHAAMGRAGAISLVEPAADGAVMRPSAAEPSLRETLTAVPAGAPRRALLEASVKTEVAAVLRLAVARLPSDRALRTLGMDSLMALELRNRLEKRSGASLSPTLVWNHPTVQALAEHLAERLQLDLDAPAAVVKPAPAAADAELDALLDELAQMSDDDARALLQQGDSR